MYVQVHTYFGLQVEVQVFPEIQLYITPPANHTGLISGEDPRLQRRFTLMTVELIVRIAFQFEVTVSLFFRPLWQRQQ